jgi:phosphohistidine phosphatase
MDLYVIRHAPAEPRTRRVPDSERRLSEVGRERFAAQVRGLHRLGVEFDLLLHSPLRRSVETAQMLRPLVVGVTRRTESLMHPPGRELVLLLRDRTVGVVGQEPWLTELIAWLLFGDVGRAGCFELEEGAIACLEGYAEEKGMTLRSLIPSRWLQSLAARPPRV